jgi:CBS domain-containing protein
MCCAPTAKRRPYDDENVEGSATMDSAQITLLLLIGVGLLIVSLMLRVFTQGKYEIKTIDLVFIILPLLFVGVATGKLRGLDLFGVKADLSELWAKAADTQIEQQVSTVPVSPVSDAIEMVETAEKRGVNAIPRLIEQRTQALAFRLGAGGYYWEAIRKYFEDLYGSSYLRYVVVNYPDGRLFGIYQAADLVAYLRTLGEAGYEEFEHMLNRGDEQAQAWLSRLPGFVSAGHAVSPETSKRAALQAMENLDQDSLPVTNSAGHLVGTVERAKLTSSLILAVTEKLAGEAATNNQPAPGGAPEPR